MLAAKLLAGSALDHALIHVLHMLLTLGRTDGGERLGEVLTGGLAVHIQVRVLWHSHHPSLSLQSDFGCA
jgi:hypothetical protein